MRIVRVLALAGCVLAWAHSAAAQQAIDSASIGGRVADRSGAVLPGTAITARQLATNIASAVITDQDGRFRFPYLKVGSYEITAHRDGFRDLTRRLALTAGSAYELPLVLAVAGVDANVTVTGQEAVLEGNRTQIAGTVSNAEIRSVPLNGRDFLDLALLVPGVAPANVGTTQLFPETSAVPGVSLSVGSQRNLSNSFIVDGLSANDDAAGLSGITYGVDAVEQVQVVTSGGQAELGRALGGYVNVVTRSGTNVLHGSAYDYVRDARFNARNPLSGTRLPMHQAQFGGTLGGPLVKDRAFYFTNLEQRRLDQSGLATIHPASVAAVNARLRAVGYQGPPVTTGEFANPVDSTNLLAKVDHQVSGGDQLGVRYGQYNVSSSNSRGAGGLNAPSASSGLENRDRTFAVNNTWTLSARTVLETRAQFAHGDLSAQPSDPIGPAVTIAGVASFGTSSGSPTRRVNSQYQLVNALTHQAGSHAFRIGSDFLYNADRIAYPRAVRGAYTFSSMANFLRGVYNIAGFTQTFGDSEVSQRNPNLGVCAQDEWKVGSRVTANLGVRYDLQWLETIATDTSNISPRAGIAWSPFDSRGTVVRGSAGLFYDRVPLRPLANALLSAGNTTDLRNLRQIGVSLSPSQAGAPVFPAIRSGIVPSVTSPNLTTMDRHLQNAYSRQASVEIEQQLGGGISLGAGYVYLRGRSLLMAINQNVPACSASGTNNGCRPNPAYANNSQYSGAGESAYHGLHVSFVQRPSRWGFYRVSYTLSRSRNNVGEFFFSAPIDPLDLSKDWGRSDDDQRHRLVVHAAVQSPMTSATTAWGRIGHGFQLSGMLQAYSALPFNITSGVTTVQGTPGRPVVNGAFIERNAGVGDDFLSLNARLSRVIDLPGRAEIEAVAEAFNVTNHRNDLARNTNFGPGAYPASPSPTFGQITAVGDSRSWQFALRLRF